MKRFAELFERLDQTTKTNERIQSLVWYLNQADDRDKIWTIALLTGKRPKRRVNSTAMKEWAADLAGIPMWLFEESYQVVGDMAETIALLLPDHQQGSECSLSEWMQKILLLEKGTDEKKQSFVLNAWKQLNPRERFVFNKLIGGSFRIGVSQKTMVRALARSTGKSENDLAHRLMGNWSPETSIYSQLILESTGEEDLSRPYPFYLAHPLDEKANFKADSSSWSVEWKWDGIRGQLIKRKDQLFVWTRGEELVTDKYPELVELQSVLPDGVALDGEILPFKNGVPMTFNDLQKRIGRKKVGKKLLNDVPVLLMAYDLMELDGKDIRNWPFKERRTALERLIKSVNHPNLRVSEIVDFEHLEDLKKLRAHARIRHAEGLMLKKKNSIYGVGRKRGDWWKWKVDPLVIDAVLIYAMRGHGRRANLYTDYTFAVWDNDQLVPFTKAYSGLTDKEFQEVDRFVKANIIEKFGPVRSVTPQLVFEIAFEGINRSTRHKSGIAIRFPRMSRWRKDKPAQEANTLQDLENMLNQYDQSATAN